MAVSWPDHLLSLDEWAALPPDPTRRFELVEGVLLVTPRPALLHQRAMIRLATALDTQLPADLCAIGDVEVVVDTGGDRPGAAATVRVPDVVVVRSVLAEQNPPRVDASDVVLAVEIISLGTRTTDRVTKTFQYAEAGIPGYWLIDIDPPATLTAYLLVDGDYEIVAEGQGVLEVVSPVTARVDLSGLTAR